MGYPIYTWSGIHVCCISHSLWWVFCASIGRNNRCNRLLRRCSRGDIYGSWWISSRTFHIYNWCFCSFFRCWHWYHRWFCGWSVWRAPRNRFSRGKFRVSSGNGVQPQSHLVVERVIHCHGVSRRTVFDSNVMRRVGQVVMVMVIVPAVWGHHCYLVVMTVIRAPV